MSPPDILDAEFARQVPKLARWLDVCGDMKKYAKSKVPRVESFAIAALILTIGALRDTIKERPI